MWVGEIRYLECEDECWESAFSWEHDPLTVILSQSHLAL